MKLSNYKNGVWVQNDTHYTACKYDANWKETETATYSQDEKTGKWVYNGKSVYSTLTVENTPSTSQVKATAPPTKATVKNKAVKSNTAATSPKNGDQIGDATAAPTESTAAQTAQTGDAQTTAQSESPVLADAENDHGNPAGLTTFIWCGIFLLAAAGGVFIFYKVKRG